MIVAALRESFKGIALLLFFAALIIAFFSWTLPDRPTAATYAWAIGATVTALASFVAFLVLHWRRDIEPDYLHARFGGFLERHGLCFAFGTHQEDNLWFFDLYFQNKFERPCEAYIVLRPAMGWLGTAIFAPIEFDIHCGPAAFGVTKQAIGVPKELQGKQLKLEIGATVNFPHGHGRLLRFRVGEVIRTSAGFGFGFHLGSRRVHCVVDLPVGVAEDTPQHAKAEKKTIWQLGEPPLDTAFEALYSSTIPHRT